MEQFEIEVIKEMITISRNITQSSMSYGKKYYFDEFELQVNNDGRCLATSRGFELGKYSLSQLEETIEAKMEVYVNSIQEKYMRAQLSN
jgi:hypothetical protein